ncbi:hypothetical protein HYH02_011360 [Chlamydomonas schloesseri]|uniref:Uncharacterized protein n=1 Tax=Chlamydomonas schloesseri TaxID=2026947 RepID=A0A835T4Y0_9CHLO|nr:hypothetical protein HYH02_011360 [Chlamydomonas schloesseri]|eukprot:KAG2437102.1 hypothetical protein HYH02_011360 [Chlamydomonas schloesseri]
MGTKPVAEAAGHAAADQPGGTIPRPLAERGVSMKMLQDFVRVHPEAVNASTVAVVELVVLLTREHKCSYTELPPSPLDDGTFYGPATHFVSHARACMFSDLIDVISREEEEEEDEVAKAHVDPAAPRTANYFWIDVFAINHHPCTTKCQPPPRPGAIQQHHQQQHQQQQQQQQSTADAETEVKKEAAGALGPAEANALQAVAEARAEAEAAEAEELVEQLQGVVRRCSTTLALLSPWQSPTALGQAWCLFEHMTGPGGLRYVTSRSQERDLLAHVGERHEQFMQLVSGVDIRTCRASREAEKAAMVARLQLVSAAAPPQQGESGNSGNSGGGSGTCGIEALNAGVRAALRQWLRGGVAKAVAALSQEHGPDDSRVARLRALLTAHAQ